MCCPQLMGSSQRENISTEKMTPSHRKFDIPVDDEDFLHRTFEQAPDMNEGVVNSSSRKVDVFRCGKAGQR